MLQQLAHILIIHFLKIKEGSRVAETLIFFVYDSLKILLLLFSMISIIGFIRSFIPHAKIKKWATSSNEFISSLFAALFGALTPFCSCSSIPIFLSFIKIGVPLSATFSFLVASPLINEYLVVLMIGFFGLKITIFYVLSGLVIGIVSGLLVGKMKMEKYLEKGFKISKNAVEMPKFKGLFERIKYGLNEGISIVISIWLWVVIGVGVGAAIHNYVPQELIQNIVNRGGIFTVPLATLIGIPMYGSCAAIVPIAVVLFQKGVPLGTALAFMMAVSALSLPEAIILRRAMKLRLIAVFFGIVGLGIIINGYLINYLASILVK